MIIKGTIRNMDNLGRVVVPKEYRRSMNLRDDDPMEVLLTSEGVLVRKVPEDCAICGGRDQLLEINNHYVCRHCADEIKKL